MTTITALVPTLGRKTLQASLDSINAQTRKADVIDLINDPSTITHKLIVGVNRCTTDYIALLDDDAVFPPNFFEDLEKKLNESPDNYCANGSCLPLLNDNSSDLEFGIAITQQSYLASYKLADRFKVGEPTDDGEDVVVGVGLYRTEILREILNSGTLSTTQDLDVFMKIRMMGGKICYVPSASYLHHPRDSIWRYFMQTFRSGVGRTNIIRRNPKELLRKPYYISPLGLIVFLSTCACTGYWTGISLYGVAILLGWSINLATLSERPKAILYYPVLVVLTHISYGLGLMAGIFKRDVRWK